VYHHLETFESASHYCFTDEAASPSAYRFSLCGRSLRSWINILVGNRAFKVSCRNSVLRGSAAYACNYDRVSTSTQAKSRLIPVGSVHLSGPLITFQCFFVSLVFSCISRVSYLWIRPRLFCEFQTNQAVNKLFGFSNFFGKAARLMPGAS